VFFYAREQYQFVQQLRNDGKPGEASAIFEVVCADVARIFCETDSRNEAFLSSQLESVFASVPQSLEQQVVARKLAGEKIRFVTKKRLQEILTDMFKESFAGQCLDFLVDEADCNPWTGFRMKCRGWTLFTQFVFGRDRSLINYTHRIESETRIQHPENPQITGPAMTLCPGICWPCAHAHTWEYLSEADAGQACEGVITYCRYFFEAAPKLLKGLEFEKLEAN
jgi:hypothetical protein